MDHALSDKAQSIADAWTSEVGLVYMIRDMPDGSVCLVYPFITSWGLCYDVEEMSFGGRFCFHSLTDAFKACDDYEGGRYEIPEGAIRCKGYLKEDGSGQLENWPDSQEECFLRSEVWELLKSKGMKSVFNGSTITYTKS